QPAISNSDSVATTPIAFLAMITSPSYVDGRNGEIPSSIVALKHGKVLFGNGRGASSHPRTRARKPSRHPRDDGARRLVHLHSGVGRAGHRRHGGWGGGRGAARGR